MVREKQYPTICHLSCLFNMFRISTGGHAGVGKVFMQLRGLDMGPPRLPVLPLSPDQAKALETSLRDIGFFDWT